MVGDKTGATRVGRLGRVATSSFAVFLAVVVALHFVQPELHPFRRFVSEYAVGRMGWLLNAGFFFFALGLAALATAFGWLLDLPARTRVGGTLLGLSALGILASGLFNADLQGADLSASGIVHDLAGFVAFFGLMPGAIIASRRLARAGRLRGRHRWLDVLAWMVVALFLAMMFVFGPLGLVGLGQRVFLCGVFAWLLTAAHGLRTGAFDELRAGGRFHDELGTTSEPPVAHGQARRECGRGTIHPDGGTQCESSGS